MTKQNETPDELRFIKQDMEYQEEVIKATQEYATERLKRIEALQQENNQLKKELDFANDRARTLGLHNEELQAENAELKKELEETDEDNISLKSRLGRLLHLIDENKQLQAENAKLKEDK